MVKDQLAYKYFYKQLYELLKIECGEKIVKQYETYINQQVKLGNLGNIEDFELSDNIIYIKS